MSFQLLCIIWIRILCQQIHRKKYGLTENKIKYIYISQLILFQDQRENLPIATNRCQSTETIEASASEQATTSAVASASIRGKRLFAIGIRTRAQKRKDAEEVEESEATPAKLSHSEK